MEEKENIKLAFFLNLGFSLFELIGGLLTNSICILSDAIHDLGDSLAIGISYILEKISNKEKNKKYTYGYKRYSVLGAMITSVILIISSIVVLVSSIIRLFNPLEINFLGMFVFAIFGITINGYAAFKTSKSVNLNEKSINLHMLEDVLGWAGILIGSLLIKVTGWNFIDPVISILIAIFIGYKAIKNIFDVLNIILEKVPESIDVDSIKDEIKKIDMILDVHHVHAWSIDENDFLITMHLVVTKNVTKKNYESIKTEVKECLKSFNIYHSTLEIEYEDCENINCS